MPLGTINIIDKEYEDGLESESESWPPGVVESGGGCCRLPPADSLTSSGQRPPVGSLHRDRRDGQRKSQGLHCARRAGILRLRCISTESGTSRRSRPESRPGAKDGQ